MANGILNLETDDNKQDENLFLSAPEQRGLEAATFATAIGAAPSTGNIFGDLLSVAAQTGPAALATFKERQSIKEKEAEYKQKKASLAEKLDPVFVTSNIDPTKSFFVTGDQFKKNALLPPDMQPFTKFVKTPKSNRVIEVFERQPDNTFSDAPVPVYADLVVSDALKPLDQRRYKMPADHKTYYISGGPKGQEVEEFAKTLPKSKVEELIAQGFTLSEEPSLEYEINRTERLTNVRKLEEKAITAQDEARKQFAATSSVLDIGKEIERLVNDPTVPTVTGAANEMVALARNLSSFVSSGYDVIFDPSNETDMKTKEKADAAIAELYNRGAQKGSLAYIAANPEEYGIGGKGQAISSLLTQLVYRIAKSRESGGKFSVPDIEFAFQSAGQGSDSELLLVGISKLIKDTVDTNVKGLVSAYTRDPKLAKKYTKEDGSLDDQKLHTDIFFGSGDFGGLQVYRNVMQFYYEGDNIRRKNIPKSWENIISGPTFDPDKYEEYNSFIDSINLPIGSNLPNPDNTNNKKDNK